MVSVYKIPNMFRSHRIWKFILSFFCLLCIWGAFFVFFRVNSGTDLYGEYMKLWDYRRLHPQYQPDVKVVRAFDAGHTNSYADLLWINLIQYIADNVGNGKYTEYATPLLDTISKLHPHFTRSYTLALLLTPSLYRDGLAFEEKNIDIGKKNLEIWIRWIAENCDSEKIQKIEKWWIRSKPWDNAAWKNPCTDWYLPYYAAYIADGLGKRALAQKYYTIASANTDAPQASRFLALLMQWKDGNRLDAALQFFLIASSGYDEAPFTCRDDSLDILSRVQKWKSITPELITLLEKHDTTIEKPKDTKNPLAASSTNCFDSFHRWAKQFYLAYITEISRASPETIDWASLIKKWLLWTIPKPFWWEDLKVLRGKNGWWEYKKIFN